MSRLRDVWPSGVHPSGLGPADFDPVDFDPVDFDPVGFDPVGFDEDFAESLISHIYRHSVADANRGRPSMTVDTLRGVVRL
ncbi:MULTISPECIES: hypothetical protein [Gordonia]|uniref:hypothetical protein n=1 Tax=Gordonia TaxID=2053 RepID=UPI0025C32F1E|nr:hypothetical protein [Gordonia sp. UBA5067]